MSKTPSSAGSLPRLIDIDELFADPVFSNASISPDGKRIAYLAPKNDRTNVWVRGVHEEHDKAICVTHDSRRGIKKYYWTRDPRWLLYIQDTDGNEEWHVYRVDLEAPDKPAVDLTPLPPGGRALGIEILKSAPGKMLVGMNRRPMFFDLFEVDIATGETRLHREQSDVMGSYLGSEGRANFYQEMAKNGDYEFYAVDEQTGDKRLIYRAPGREHASGVYPMTETADGNSLLLGVYQDSDDLRLVRVDPDGKQTVIATEPGHSLDNIAFLGEQFNLPPTLLTSRRTGEVIAVRFVGDKATIKPLDPHFAEVYAELSKLSDGVLASASSDESEQLWVASFIHDRDPGLTYLYDHRTRKSRLLFRPFPKLNPAELAPMKPVALKARDGLPLHGFLTLPLGVEPKGLPLILCVHGGPWIYNRWGYDREAQLFANRGYAVLQVNFRGSLGYGKRHVTAGIKELAGKMHDDLIDAADWVVKQGIADPKRMGIMGGSYGGYATLVGVTFTPDYFAAACEYVGVSNLVTFMRSQPEFVKPHLVNNWMLYAGDPDDPVQEADMLARSPVTRVDRIRTPLLVLQGRNDARVVKAESDNIVASLRKRGVPVEYLVADDEGHGFQNPENVKLMYRAVERHFGKYLGGRISSRDVPMPPHMRQA
ncbi:MAG TPA: S9 family peptidase [Steroidobacteraceae bacterium]|nr:S9 family peptidase [Steroidobacteraceae bacterium]